MSTACSFTHEIVQATPETFEEELLKWPAGEELNNVLIKNVSGFRQTAGSRWDTHSNLGVLRLPTRLL